MFDVEAWHKTLPAEEFGPHIDFREYSLLENVRMPQVCVSRRRSDHNDNTHLINHLSRITIRVFSSPESW